MQQIILIIILLVSAIPLALLLASITKDEKQTYKKFFPAFLWITAILTAIFFKINTKIILTTAFIFLLLLVWNYSDKITKILKTH